METFDTNVVLRLVYGDDALQCARADAAWKQALEAGGIYLSTTVLVELAWVLRVAAKFDRAAITSALRHLCDSAGVTVEHEVRVRRALALYEVGPADFSDYVILETASDAGALPVRTFDERSARDTDVQTIAAAATRTP